MPIVPQLNAHPWEGQGWRAIEAQHKNATMSLVGGDLAAQAILEDIIENAKPALPHAAQGLHFLLSTPFRYLPPPPNGSRFRGRFDLAAFYGAEDIKTACAEAGYWRVRFWMDSKGLATQSTSMPMTLFEFHGATSLLIDLTAPPLVSQRIQWIHKNDYDAPQALAREARLMGIEVIRSESVRHSPDGRCLTILTPNVFKATHQPYRGNQQTWNLFVQPPNVAIWSRDLSGDCHQFSY